LEIKIQQKEKYKTKSRKMKKILSTIKSSSSDFKEFSYLQDLILKDEAYTKVDDSVSFITNLLSNMKKSMTELEKNINLEDNILVSVVDSGIEAVGNSQKNKPYKSLDHSNKLS